MGSGELLRVLTGDALEMLRGEPDESVQCCVTSPPYWGLRDYGTVGQLGLEKTPEEYVAKMVEVFREVRRVLKNDGTLWLNLGDTYYRDPAKGDRAEYLGLHKNISDSGCHKASQQRSIPAGMKQKDLVGIPWMMAFALRADGWYLRQDIIWSKANPMPESVTDRCTKAHEYLFLLSKSPRYYYDADAIKEPTSGTAHARGDGVNPKASSWKTPDGWDTSKGDGGHGKYHKNGREKGKKTGRNSRQCVDRDPAHIQAKRPKQNESFSGAINELVDERNKRSVWTIATAPFPEAHFATYPPDLIKPCILAGSKPGDVIVDPFGGSGTTGMVAIELGRKALLIELNPQYVKLIETRCDVTPGLAI